MNTADSRVGAWLAEAAGEDGHGCVTVRSHRRTASVVHRIGDRIHTRGLPARTERTTTAFMIRGAAASAPPVPQYAAVTGTGTCAVRAVLEHCCGRGLRTVPPTGQDVQLVDEPYIRHDLAAIMHDLVHRLPWQDIEVTAEAHSDAEDRLQLTTSGAAHQETARSSAIVVDLWRNGQHLAEADLACTGPDIPDLAPLVSRLGRSLQRTTAPTIPVPPRVQLLLADGSAGAFLHEVCGHLLESTRSRPSLVEHHIGQAVACDRITLHDDPCRPAGFGTHSRTALGLPTQRRPLLEKGRLTNLLQDTPDGPWRAEDAHHRPQPRMSHLDLTPAATSDDLDVALGSACAPVLLVHRLGFGSLDHRDGTVVLEVKEACHPDGTASFEPFLVTGEARHLLRDVRALGDAATSRTWSAYCLASSGSLPVGATTPALLTGPMATRPHQRLTLPKPATRQRTD